MKDVLELWQSFVWASQGVHPLEIQFFQDAFGTMAFGLSSHVEMRGETSRSA